MQLPQHDQHFGFLREVEDVAGEYERLAEEDEQAGRMLHRAAMHQQAAYFYLQSMEKRIRAKVFTRVNPELEWFRASQRNHSLEEAIELLMQVCGTNSHLRAHMEAQLGRRLLPGLEYLNSDLRYPFWRNPRRGEAKGRHVMRTMRSPDADDLYERLCFLKTFLKQIDSHA